MCLCTDNATGVGDLEITPVSSAIARHLGIDLTPEGRAARNRRGIVIVVNGTPSSGTERIYYHLSHIFCGLIPSTEMLIALVLVLQVKLTRLSNLRKLMVQLDSLLMGLYWKLYLAAIHR